MKGKEKEGRERGKGKRSEEGGKDKIWMRCIRLKIEKGKWDEDEGKREAEAWR